MSLDCNTSRSIKELYVRLLVELQTQPFICICWVIDNLYALDKINSSEYTRLTNHFKENKPTKQLHPEFYNHSLYIGDKSAYWWRTYVRGGESSKKVRIDFIQKMIKITS